MRAVVLILALIMFSPTSFAFEKTEKDEGQASRDTVPKADKPRKPRADKKKFNGPRKEGKGRVRDRGFKRLDLDHDGVLSFDEFSKSERLIRLDTEKRRKLFDFLDHNKDGNLQGFELTPREPQWAVVLREKFKQLDADADGMLDQIEFSELRLPDELHEIDHKRAFKRLDRNNDGHVDLEEIRYIPSAKPRMNIGFEKNDTNNSGGLDFEEFSNLPFVSRFPEDRRKRHFAKIDSDKNGELSPGEVQAAYKRRPHHPMDRGKDAPRRKRDKNPQNNQLN